MRKTGFLFIFLLFACGCINNSKDTPSETQTIEIQRDNPLYNFENTKPAAKNDSSSITANKLSKPEQEIIIKFDGKTTPGHIKVKKLVEIGPNNPLYKRLKGRPAFVTVGWISKSRDGMYRYYESNKNELKPVFVGSDLEVLKDKITARQSK